MFFVCFVGDGGGVSSLGRSKRGLGWLVFSGKNSQSRVILPRCNRFEASSHETNEQLQLVGPPEGVEGIPSVCTRREAEEQQGAAPPARC